MKVTAIQLAIVLAILPTVGIAATSTDLYSESVTRQLSSAEVPKSFDSNARHASVSTNADSDADLAMDSRIVESAILSADADEANEVVNTASRKAPKKQVKKASR